ncbi:enoyl-CoA hydratase/isomerase family protein [Salinisphaera orenii]|uniref:Enoyl-CoA hydratase n=1 Tax=Salinisphaera orenii YIM 95161 TaxID=1051139 RepID=A0A423PHW9_9GAMM|nr:enoyl-CoA hydratase/isomerase family protein [Salinisphaera halophila]ROO25180.1 enoyl-CoA hydratase [Salinisphaera halophila YIM 95161]
MSADALVSYRIEHDIAHLRLQRAERHNALVPALLRDLRAVLGHARAAAPRALVLSAAGRSFSTGGDVRAFYDTPRPARRDYAAAVVGELNAAILDLLRLPFPTLVCVQGTVTGGALGLMLACDIAIATPKASFAPWYTAVGFSPDGGWSALLPERIGRTRALEIQLLNRRVGADEAWRIGLVHRLADDDSAQALALDMAASLCAAWPRSVARTLALTRPDIERTRAALDAEYREFLDQIESDEADAGMARFLAAR